MTDSGSIYSIGAAFQFPSAQSSSLSSSYNIGQPSSSPAGNIYGSLGVASDSVNQRDYFSMYNGGTILAFTWQQTLQNSYDIGRFPMITSN